MWLRDSLGLAKPAIALTISLGAGATVPARCLLPQPAAFSTPLRAGAERTVLVQCRDAFGNPAPRGRDQVAMVLSARGLPTVVARCAPAAEGVYRLSVAPTRAAAYAVALSCNGAPLELPAGCPPPSLRVIAAEPHVLGLRAVPPPTGLAPGAPCDEGWHLPLAELDGSVGAPGGLPLLPLARSPALVEAGTRCQLRVAMVDVFGNPCSAQVSELPHAFAPRRIV